jgi:hypothetical protein
MNLTRRELLQTLPGTAAAACFGASAIKPAGAAAKPRVKRAVSVYSYQEELYLRTMTLEESLREISDLGAEGVEVNADADIPGFPDPPDRWVAQWHEWLAKYRLAAACYGQFQEIKLYKHRPLTDEEGVEMMTRDLKLANRLGFKVLRPIDKAPFATVVKCLPAAEKLDVRIAYHVHTAGLGGIVDQVVEYVQKTNSKHLGFTVDTSLFIKRPIRVMRDRAIRDGVVTEAIADYIDKAWETGVPQKVAAAEAARMGYKEVPRGYSTYLGRVYWAHVERDPKEQLLKLLPYSYHAHGKFFEMTEDLKEYSIPYEQVIPVLMEGGYDYYIASEYEGQRYVQDVAEPSGIEQVRRQQAMWRRLLGEV